MKILVPSDFSVPGALACRFATDMAFLHQGEVLVMKTAEYFFSSFGQDPGKHASDLVIERGPITIIAPAHRLIREEAIDLVIAGTDGSMINDDLIGIDTAIHLATCPIPVLTLRKGSKATSIKNIVLPISMRTDQTEFVLRARSLQELYSAHIFLLLAKKDPFQPSDIHAMNFVDAFARHFRIYNYTPVVRTDMDQTGCIIDFALQVNADLILWGINENMNNHRVFSV